MIQTALIKLIRFYKLAISPHLKTQCKFYPTCSEYAILALKKYGPITGIYLTILRLLRCNPLSDGGIDFP